MPEVRLIGSAAIIARGMAGVQAAVAQSAEALAADAGAQAPVDTGTLRASIHVQSVEASGTEVKATVSTGGEASEYAVYQELGTSKMAAQPFMTPALAAHAPVHRRMCETAWKAGLGG